MTPSENDDHPRKARTSSNFKAMNAKILRTEFVRSNVEPRMRICILHLTNGLCVIGKSDPADHEKVDQTRAAVSARTDALSQLWRMEECRLPSEIAPPDYFEPAITVTGGKTMTHSELHDAMKAMFTETLKVLEEQDTRIAALEARNKGHDEQMQDFKQAAFKGKSTFRFWEV